MSIRDGRRKRSRGLIAAVGACALVVTACGADDEPTTEPTAEPGDETPADETPAAGAAAGEWDGIVEAAQQEGEAVWYGTQIDEWTEAVIPAAQDATGITMVAAPRAATGAILERLLSEQEAGNVQGDLYHVVTGSIFVEHPEWFVNLEEVNLPNYADYPDDRKWPSPGDDVRCMEYAGDTAGLAYNTELVPEEQVPQSWQDIIGPFWDGKVALTDPRASPTYNAWAHTMLDESGVDFLETIGSYNPDLFDSASPAAEQLAAGAYAISYMSHFPNSYPVREAGAPVEYVIPEGPTFGHFACVGVLADGPNTNAGLVLLNWLMSPEAHAVGCEVLPQTSPLNVEECPQPPDFWEPTPKDPETGAFYGEEYFGTPEQSRVLEPLGIE